MGAVDLKEYWQKNRKTIRKIIGTRLRGHYDDDLIQEVESKLYLYLHRTDYLSNTKTRGVLSQLYDAVKGTVSDHWSYVHAKRRDTRDYIYSDAYETPIPVECEYPPEKFDLSKILTETELKILRLRYEGYSYQEVIGITGISSTTLARRIRTLQRIYTQYETGDQGDSCL